MFIFKKLKETQPANHHRHVDLGQLGVFVKNIGLPSLEIDFLRAVIAGVCPALSGFWVLTPNSRRNIKRDLVYLIASGAAIGLNWVLLFQAYRYTTVANASLSYYFAPLIVVLLSPLVLEEKLSLVKVGSVAGAGLGLYWGQILTSFSFSEEINKENPPLLSKASV